MIFKTHNIGDMFDDFKHKKNFSIHGLYKISQRFKD